MGTGTGKPTGTYLWINEFAYDTVPYVTYSTYLLFQGEKKVIFVRREHSNASDIMPVRVIQNQVDPPPPVNSKQVSTIFSFHSSTHLIIEPAVCRYSR